MINTIKKDITTVESGILCHGVNCLGVMGAGVALAIKNKWPSVYETYSQMPTGSSMLGSAHLVNLSPKDGPELYVANCYTQATCGLRGRFAEVAAVESSLSYAYKMAAECGLDIYMPMIGAGLGGLDWNTDVLPVVEALDAMWCDTNTYICVL